eukprot:15438951-Alexandrium_andersonii.AAC.1
MALSRLSLASSHRREPNVQSAIRPNARQRCDPPQSAVRHAENAQFCARRSHLELRGPRNGLKMGPRSSRG